MNRRNVRYIISLITVCVIQAVILSGCSKAENSEQIKTDEVTAVKHEDAVDLNKSLIDTTDLFSQRDLEQEVDDDKATNIKLQDGKNVDITEEGTYLITGTGSDTTINVDTSKKDKVNIVLDNVSITNTDSPAIYVTESDKVFITTTESENVLKVSGTYKTDENNNIDAVIYSKSDLVMNGKGTLTVDGSTGNGITSKDDLKVTGGTYKIDTLGHALEANETIRICDGSFDIKSGKDGIHCKNKENEEAGYIYISNGNFNIEAGGDGISGTAFVQIEGGNINIPASLEGIEAASVMINAGTINIYATDDGINASQKSSVYDVKVIFNGGTSTISVGPGDTDGIDSNGSIEVNGGTIDVTAQLSSFDYDTTAALNGGKVIVNGEVVTEIPESMMGGHGPDGGPGSKGGNHPDRPQGTPPAGMNKDFDGNNEK